MDGNVSNLIVEFELEIALIIMPKTPLMLAFIYPIFFTRPPYNR